MHKIGFWMVRYMRCSGDAIFSLAEGNLEDDPLKCDFLPWVEQTTIRGRVQERTHVEMTGRRRSSRCKQLQNRRRNPSSMRRRSRCKQLQNWRRNPSSKIELQRWRRKKPLVRRSNQSPSLVSMLSAVK